MAEPSIYIRPAVQASWDKEAERRNAASALIEKHDLSKTNHAHSPEAIKAPKEWRDPGGILLPKTDTDWWCWGYDAAGSESNG
jgi:hypothetical protein